MIISLKRIVRICFTGLLLIFLLGRTNLPVVASNNDAGLSPVTLYDNGPLVTHPGSGSGSADVSALQTSLGMTTSGLNHQFLPPPPNRVADDFVIPSGETWKIEDLTFYAYQTGAATNPSTITGVYFQVWDGPPNNAGSHIMWGNLTTNRLITTTWSNIYRAPETELTNTTRPIMTNTASGGLTLGPGTYWLDWTTNGSLTSGPWAPPITILGLTTTGNGLQYFNSSWMQALDAGTSTQQGLPFIITGYLLDQKAYLPLTMNKMLFILPTPNLNTIENTDGNGKYTISWSESEGAGTYTLQEDDDPSFSGPTEVYSGTARSVAICCRAVGNYYYRVRAATAYIQSEWSNTQSTVVTIPVPPCPQTGAWSGWTNQGRQINFIVSDTPYCRIVSLDIGYYTQCENGGSAGYRDYFSSTPIEYDYFTKYFLEHGSRVSGTFSSLTSASGSWSADFTHEVNGHCWASGTWSADQ